MSISKIRTWPAYVPRHLPQKHGKKTVIFRTMADKWLKWPFKIPFDTVISGSAKRFRIRFGPGLHPLKQDISLQSTTSWKVKLFLGTFYKNWNFWMGNYVDRKTNHISRYLVEIQVCIYIVDYILYAIYIYDLLYYIYMYIYTVDRNLPVGNPPHETHDMQMKRFTGILEIWVEDLWWFFQGVLF